MTFLYMLRELLSGAVFTILVTAASTGAALCGVLPWRPLRYLSAAFTFVFRGIPVLVLIFLVFFGLPGIGIRLSPFLSVVISLGLVSGAYLAEIFRGAIKAVDRDEIVVAESMGMSRVQAFFYIVVPQVARFSVPGMINEFTSVLKYSPFAYTVGIPEITKEATEMAAVSMNDLEIFLMVGILYFLIYKVCVVLFEGIEKRFRIPGLTAK